MGEKVDTRVRLKSGPAMAGVAGPSEPPLSLIRTGVQRYFEVSMTF